VKSAFALIALKQAATSAVGVCLGRAAQWLPHSFEQTRPEGGTLYYSSITVCQKSFTPCGIGQMIPTTRQCSWSSPEIAAQFTVKRSHLCQGLLATSRYLPYEADVVVPSLLPCHSIVGFPGFYKLWVSTFSSMRSLDNTGSLGKYIPTARLCTCLQWAAQHTPSLHGPCGERMAAARARHRCATSASAALTDTWSS
jgi:hypothetical protein